MENTNKKNLERNNNFKGEKNSGPDGTATHSGWNYFYASFARYRDECMRLGKDVLGNNLSLAVNSLSEYHSALYSMAQQVFSFYDLEKEDEITKEWLLLGEEVNDFISKISDKDFRQQMVLEGSSTFDKDLKLKLLKFFNKVDRMAAEAGLLVGQENKGSSEPKKGLIGLGRK